MSTNDSKQGLELARRAVQLAQAKGAQEAAAVTSRSRGVEVRWRDEKLDAINESTQRSLSLELFVDGRYSAVSTSDTRPEALEAFVAGAVAMARALAPDPHRRLPEPELYRGRSDLDLALADPAHAGVTPERRKAAARTAVEAARAADTKGAIVSVTGSFEDEAVESHRVHSNGFEGSRSTTVFATSAAVSCKDADGRRPEDYASRVSRYLAELPDPAALGREAAQRALGRLGAQKGQSAVLPVAVDARAAGRLVGMFLQPLSASAVQQKRSFLDGKVGQRVGSAHFTLADEPLVPRGLGSRHFDGEGLAARRMPLVEGGVLRALYVDTYYGRKLKLAPTTGSMSNLGWATGSAGQDALLAGMKDGILVTGFLGGNSNAATGDYSLGILGYRVRNGQRAEPLSEMNIAGNQAELWARLVAVGNDPFPSSAMRTPTLVFEGLSVAGT